MTVPSLSESLGWQVIGWVEHYLIHGPGDVQGDPVRLDDELAGFIVRAYRLTPKGRAGAGRRRVRRAFLSRAKGRAKSELAGLLCCVEALGPVRFDRWARGGEETSWGYRFEAGEPIGRPVRYPFIRCLATEEGQSSNTFANVAFMLHPDTCSDRLVEDFGRVDAGRDWQTSTRIYLPDGGEIRPSTASSAAKDGGKESFAVADETHLYVMPELRAMHATVLRNLRKRRDAEPWMLETSTMYAPGEDSVAERTHQAHERRPDGAVLFDHRQASASFDECTSVADAVGLLEEAYGEFSGAMDLRAIAEDILDGTLEDPDRYYGNRPTHRADAWAQVGQWDARARVRDERGEPVRSDPPPEGLRVTVGFDGSWGTSDDRVPDSTALRAAVLEDGDWSGYVWTLGIWEADDDPDWVPPEDEVDAAMDAVFGSYDVWRAYCDPAYWRDRIKTWKSRHGDDRVHEWETNRDRQMAAALEALHGAVHGPAGELSHDGDPRARAHYANARRRVKKARVESDDPDGRKELVLVRKETPRSALKIDTVLADALAWWARGDGIADGANKVRRRTKAYGF